MANATTLRNGEKHIGNKTTTKTTSKRPFVQRSHERAENNEEIKSVATLETRVGLFKNDKNSSRTNHQARNRRRKQTVNEDRRRWRCDRHRNRSWKACRRWYIHQLPFVQLFVWRSAHLLAKILKKMSHHAYDADGTCSKRILRTTKTICEFMVFRAFM